MGLPFECHRGVREISWYTQENLSGIYNDDVDLQLVFLRACEKYGNKVDSQILAEFWLNYISMSCSEYGAAKANLRAGIAPPMSGTYANDNKDSCGSFIRSEIWACLCAGNPDIAVRYALEDSMVDHGEEGVYGEVFFAAMQELISFAAVLTTVLRLYPVRVHSNSLTLLMQTKYSVAVGLAAQALQAV